MTAWSERTARPGSGATPSAAARRRPPPLTLYLHLPWCVQKCPYCDFNSHALRTTLPEAAYVDALLADAAREAPAVAGRDIVAVFIGGGTPSLFSAASLQRLLTTLAQHFELAGDAEITLEANPGTVEYGDLAGYRAAGINRLSLGAQSFDAAALSRLGRIHGPDDIHRVVAEARDAGFDNLNLDIMYGLPEQTRAQALADIEAAVDLAPEHISHYQLTLEPNTVFHRRPPPLPEDETVYTMFLSASAALARAGYGRYEVSAYAAAGRECRHNLNYWRYGDYLGLGAGAHGKLTDTDGFVTRTVKPSHPRAYLEAAAAGRDIEYRHVAAEDQVFEAFLNGLRLCDGVPGAVLERLPDEAAEALSRGLDKAWTLGLLEPRDDGGWRASDLGYRFLNDLQAQFLP